jgi:hypothetical protein
MSEQTERNKKQRTSVEEREITAAERGQQMARWRWRWQQCYLVPNLATCDILPKQPAVATTYSAYGLSTPGRGICFHRFSASLSPR